jgi:hypothetical protein
MNTTEYPTQCSEYHPEYHPEQHPECPEYEYPMDPEDFDDDVFFEDDWGYWHEGE